MTLQKVYDDMMNAYAEFKERVRREDKHLYEQWKAGGFLIDDDILSMYPTAGQVLDMINEENNE